MTNGERLTLAQLASAVGMTARNVRAYQTRGLLQAPHRVGRSSVYDGEHVRRLMQVQRARARGASLALLQTLIREGRDLDGVWSPDPQDGSPERPGEAGRGLVVDLTDPALGHTPDCLARRDVPLGPLLEQLLPDADSDVADAVRALADAGVLAGSGDQLQVPGSFACAVAALHEQGQLAAATALRLGVAVGEAAEAVALAVARTTRTLDDDTRAAAAARLGELAAAVVGRVVRSEVLAAAGPAPAADRVGA